MRVGIVQFEPILGDVSANVEKSLGVVKECIKEGVDICVFPELSLTGYNVRDLTPEVAVRLPDERISPLIELSKSIGIVVGLIEQDSSCVFYNSALFLRDGGVKHVHRKIFLPTYGMFDEARFVGRGSRVGVFDIGFGNGVVLICEDLWHFSSVYLAFVQGAKVIFALSASPGRGYEEKGMFGNLRIWRNMGEFYSRLAGSYFFFANMVGVEDGFVFPGGSFVFNPYGELTAEASLFSEQLLITDVDDAVIKSARINLPMLRDEDILFMRRELDRIMGGGCDNDR